MNTQALDVQLSSTSLAHDTSESSAVRPATRVWTIAMPAGIAICLAILQAVPWLFQSLSFGAIFATSAALWLVTKKSWATSWWACFLWGFIAIAIAFHWTPRAMAYTISSTYTMGLLVSLPLLIWDGLRFGGVYWLASRASRDSRCIWLPAALITIAAETFMPSVFPWRSGYTLLTFPWMIQAADIFGGAWTTFMIYAMAGLIIIAFDQVSRSNSLGRQVNIRERRLCDVVCVSTVLFGAIYGTWSLSYWDNASAKADHLNVALVQVDPGTTESLSQLQELTNSIDSKVDLVCWPESSGGSYEMSLTDLSDQPTVFALSREPERGLQPWPQPKSELLLGGKNYRGAGEEPDELFVTAMLIDTDQRITARYNKRFLMPFGEYVPGEQTIPGLAGLFDMAEHVQHGTDAKPIRMRAGTNVGTMLCYEDMVPTAALEMANTGADFLVCLINGSAFESPYTLLQHRLLAQLRAVECRKAFVRCAATGESCLITPTGSITKRLPLQRRDTLIVSVPKLPGKTWYTQVPWLGNSLGVLALVGWIVFKRKSRVNRTKDYVT